MLSNAQTHLPDIRTDLHANNNNKQQSQMLQVTRMQIHTKTNRRNVMYIHYIGDVAFVLCVVVDHQ